MAAEDALRRAQLMEIELDMQKQTTQELQQRLLHFQPAAIQAEKEKNAAIRELKFIKSSPTEPSKELKTIRNHQTELIPNLEKELVEKTLLIDSLRMELQQANDQHNSAEKANFEAANNINHLIADMELLVKENSDKDYRIRFQEMELNQVKLEQNIANNDVEALTLKFVSIKNEFDELTAIQTESQVEISLLKTELHQERSKAAAAEERGKFEIKRLREESDKTATEYTTLGEKASKEDGIKQIINANSYELEKLKKELEITRTRMGELRTRAEQAAFRAEAAEKGKAQVEEHIRKLKERKEKRKIAHRAYKQESLRAITIYKQSLDQHPKTLQPLSKILNIKL